MAVGCAWSSERAGKEEREKDSRLLSASLGGTVGMVSRERGLEDAARGQGPCEECQQVGQFMPGGGGARSPPFWFPLGKSLNRYTSPSGDPLALVHGSSGESLCACLISSLSGSEWGHFIFKSFSVFPFQSCGSHLVCCEVTQPG